MMLAPKHIGLRGSVAYSCKEAAIDVLATGSLWSSFLGRFAKIPAVKVAKGKVQSEYASAFASC